MEKSVYSDYIFVDACLQMGWIHKSTKKLINKVTQWEYVIEAQKQLDQIGPNFIWSLSWIPGVPDKKAQANTVPSFSKHQQGKIVRDLKEPR